MRLASLALFVFVTTTFACANDRDENAASNDDALVNAPRDIENPWAVGICSSAPNTDATKGKVGACIVPGTRCTGSLVGPNLVLTARHCTHKMDFAGAAGFCDAKFTAAALGTDGVRVTAAPTVLAENPPWLKVKEVVVPSGVSICDDDIALLVLEGNVPATDAKPIALELASLVKKPQLRPSAVSIVGRGGLTALIDPKTQEPIDAAPGELYRRFDTNIAFRCISDQPGRCSVFDLTSPPKNEFTLSVGQFLIGKGGTGGDSGAGVITQRSFDAKKPVAVGVYTAGTFDKNGVGNAGIAVRLDRHASWIVPAAKRAAQLGGYAAPAWAK